jgi:hypothetical protein
MRQSSRFTLWSVAIAVMLSLVLASTILSASVHHQLSARQRAGQANDAGVDVNLSDLPDISVTDSIGAKEPEDPRIPNLVAPSQRTISLPEMASHSLIPQGGPGQQTPGAFIDFAGASQGCNGSGWAPSDMGIAVNGNYVVQVVNECLEVFNKKTGALLAGPKDYCSLFGLAPNSGTHGCFDPRVLFDTQAGKFVIIGSYQDSNDNGYLLIATAGTPTGTWHSHIIAQGATLADYPTLGQTAYTNNPYNSVYTMCYNSFFNSGAFFDVCSFFPKKQILGVLKSWAIWENFTVDGVVQNTLQPVDSYEVSANPRAQFIVNSLNDGGAVCGAPESGLTVWAESNATGGGGGSHLSGWFTGCGSTEGYSEPASADNDTFCSACIETLDNRISAKSFWSGGNIRVSIDAYNGYSSAALGWTLVPTLDDNGGGCTGGYLCPNISGVTIAQQFCYDCGAGQGAQAWFGAIATLAGGDWTQWATFSSNAISPGPFYATNNVTWATPFHDGGSFACVNDFAWSGRWGDYNAAAPDEPGNKDVSAIWGSGMELVNTNTWGSCIAASNPQTP